MSAHKPMTSGRKGAIGKNAFLVGFLLAVATISVFWGATQCGFVNLDDDLYVTGNPQVNGGLSLNGLLYAIRSLEGGSWMPLTWLSYLLDASLSGRNPVGYHLTNVVLHGLNSGLLFLALATLSKEFWPSAFAAAWFAVHPLRLESVVWIAERKDVLSGLFFMLTLIAYAREKSRMQKAESRNHKNTFSLVVVFLLLGLMAKPMLVTVPFVLLLLDFWPLGRMGDVRPDAKSKLLTLLREKIPLLAVTLAFCTLTIWSQSAAGAVARSELGSAQLLRIPENYLFYLEKIFWPAKLNVLYPITPFSPVGAAAGTVVLVLGSVLAVRRRRDLPWLAVGWFWFIGTLIPVIGLVPVGSTWVADRYTYLPSIGIGVMLAWTARWLFGAAPRARIAMEISAILLLVGLMLATLENLPRWRDSDSLFSDSVSKGAHPGACINLGIASAERGDYDTAISLYTRALELNPESAEASYNRALAYQARGDSTRALADYNRAIELRPRYAEAHNNRGNLYASGGQFETAIRDFTQAIRLRPNYTEALANRGHAFQEIGRCREAVDDYSRAIAAKPDFAAGYHDRAAAYYQLKDYDRAWADLRTCRQLGLEPNPELIRRLETDSGRRDG
jgi:protein O-mannosyl-transferase